MISIEACFFERTKGVISSQFSLFFTILSENCSRFLPCCLRRGTPKLFAFSLLAYISETSFSTRLSGQSEHNLSPDSINENTDWCCLLGFQCDWPSAAVWGRSCGFLVQTGGPRLGPWLHAVLVSCSLFASFPSKCWSDPTNHMPRALHSCLSVFKSQFAWSLKQLWRAIKATAVQFPTENFLPISKRERMCVCVFMC